MATTNSTAVNLCVAEAVAEAPVVAGERCGSAAGRPVSSGKERAARLAGVASALAKEAAAATGGEALSSASRKVLAGRVCARARAVGCLPRGAGAAEDGNGVGGAAAVAEGAADAKAPVVAGERCGSAAGRPVSSGKERAARLAGVTSARAKGAAAAAAALGLWAGNLNPRGMEGCQGAQRWHTRPWDTTRSTARKTSSRRRRAEG